VIGEIRGRKERDKERMGRMRKEENEVGKKGSI